MSHFLPAAFSHERKVQSEFTSFPSGAGAEGTPAPFSEQELNYIPLHIHSDYSIKDGLESVGAIVKRAVKLGIPALAITDLTNICGYIKFYSACKANGIKPILGADIMVEEKGEPGQSNHIFKLTLLAMDSEGRQNLYDILSEAWLRSDAGAFNAYSTMEEIQKFNKGIIVLNGFRGDLSYFLQQKNKKKFYERLDFYRQTFGDRFCFEITRTLREYESEFEAQALHLCQEYGFQAVATNDTCFLYGEQDIGEDGISDYQVHDVRVSIQASCFRGNEEMARIYSKEQYLKSPQEMKELFSDLPELLVNTRRIAERCNVDIELDHPRLPRYPTGDLSPAECLRQKSYEGLEERLKFLYPDPETREKERPRYVKRLEVELNVIIEMDFPGYFLIVMEFIQWSKDHDVPVGPGRGSGGGSLVAYALKITDFDPLQFDLLFERFLNPERVSMPDFDVDFCQRNREKTIEHVKITYGNNAVSQIAAFGTMAPKAAIKDVGRALGMTYGAVDFVAKMLPTQPGLAFRKVLTENPEDSLAPDFLKLFEQAKANNDKNRLDLINYALRLEGVIKIIGKHAAGVVISPTRTAEFTPLMLDSDGNAISQFDKKDVEHAGLVKFDFLGLTTLTIIQDAVNMINKRKKRLNEPPVDIHAIPYYDKASFDTLQECQTTAVFQLESDGMRKLIGDMKPDRFDDLIALVALYRPGPIKSGMVEHFVKRKHGEEEVSYPAPDFQDLDLKPILDSTYGVIVYQEQVMQLAQVLAGYSLGGADILRRAMGKKNPAEMAGQRSVFKEGAIKKGKDPDIAMKIFDQVEKFAEYGFNKSHSAAYALVAWWTLYLKVHYPAEFLAAMMTADRQHTDKLVSYINECHRLEIKVNSPNINSGYFDFTVNEDGDIIYGLGAIKGVGEEVTNQIVKIREEKGLFENYFDLFAKVGSQILNKRTVEALIFAGAFDCFGINRAQMHASYNTAVTYANQLHNDRNNGQTDLFAAFEEIANSCTEIPALVDCLPWPEKYILHQERACLGLYLSGHPISAYQEELKNYTTTTINNVHCGSYGAPEEYTIGAVVINCIEKLSKRDNSKFYILTLDDSTSQIEVPLYGAQAMVFSKIMEEREEALEKRLKALGNVDKSMTTPPPLILIMHIKAYSSAPQNQNQSEGSNENTESTLRIRAYTIETLEQRRRKCCRSLVVDLDSAFYEEHGAVINDILMRNALDVNDINRNLLLNNLQPLNPQAQLPPELALQAKRNKEQQRQNRGREKEVPFVDIGATLSLVLDNVKLNLSNQYYRFSASDDLIESLRDLAGKNAVQILLQ